MKILPIIFLGATTFLPIAEPCFPTLQNNSHILLAPDQESDIREIRKEYERINALKLKVEQFTYKTKDCVEGGEISYYTSNGQTLKVSEKGAMDDAFWQKEYYYKAGKVFFSLERLHWGAADGKTITTTYRFYFKGGKSIRQMEGQKTADLKDKASEMASIAGKLLQVKSTKNFSAVYCDDQK
ncbi:hypothetical protein [Pedobacter rhizosphaerae]|uniref:Uncharacterized protein n=1 Tax=Pedobacter rhizosphaerae TaxID=390241 RepID=A0A1H9SIR1_9SPHI|nr:hypothetical protein [Pedobacter rhizosphaerae]SER84854.1 hypothetical protein SAMN04488023_11842 [Pedobacter rhizosphaerae]